MEWSRIPLPWLAALQQLQVWTGHEAYIIHCMLTVVGVFVDAFDFLCFPKFLGLREIQNILFISLSQVFVWKVSFTSTLLQ